MRSIFESMCPNKSTRNVASARLKGKIGSTPCTIKYGNNSVVLCTVTCSAQNTEYAKLVSFASFYDGLLDIAMMILNDTICLGVIGQNTTWVDTISCHKRVCDQFIGRHVICHYLGDGPPVAKKFPKYKC
jgi:hypothetical protein